MTDDEHLRGGENMTETETEAERPRRRLTDNEKDHILGGAAVGALLTLAGVGLVTLVVVAIRELICR